MAITREELVTGTVEVSDLREWGFRVVEESKLVEGSNPPQFRSERRLRAFACVALPNGTVAEVVRSVHADDEGKAWADDVARAKVLTQLQLANGLLADMAKRLGGIVAAGAL